MCRNKVDFGSNGQYGSNGRGMAKNVVVCKGAKMIKCVGRVVVGPNEAVLGALYAGALF